MRRIDRFDKYMQYAHLNDNKVTTQLNLSIGTINKSRKEGRDLSDKVVEQILNYYDDLSKVWLLTGEGEMIIAPTQGNTQVIGTNRGTAINGVGNNVQVPANADAQFREYAMRKDAQVDELLSQNGRLISIIEKLTQ